MDGMVFDIQRFSIHDGPGIRTTVFLKGCPLRCRWCHNPESQSTAPTPLWENGSERIVGHRMTVSDVLDEVKKDAVFYQNSGGGITLSGGEPMLQAEFAYALLREAKRSGLHTCLETCGFADTADLMRMTEVTDLFLYDWKLSDDARHQAYTGVSNARIRANLAAIDAVGAHTVLRCPIIPGVNDNDAHLADIAVLANSLANLRAVEIEPYHSLGAHKYAQIGRPDDTPSFPLPTEEQLAHWLDTLRTHTFVTVKRA